MARQYFGFRITKEERAIIEEISSKYKVPMADVLHYAIMSIAKKESKALQKKGEKIRELLQIQQHNEIIGLAREKQKQCKQKAYFASRVQFAIIQAQERGLPFPIIMQIIESYRQEAQIYGLEQLITTIKKEYRKVPEIRLKRIQGIMKEGIL